MKKLILLFVLFLNSLFCFSQLNISKIEFGIRTNKELQLKEFEVRELQINVDDSTLTIGDTDPILFRKVCKFLQIYNNDNHLQSFIYMNKDCKMCLITFYTDSKYSDNRIVIIQSITNYMVIYHIKLFIS